jgi:hypothetical protein
MEKILPSEIKALQALRNKVAHSSDFKPSPNPQQPAYGLGLEVTVVENDPPAEGSIQKLYSTLLNYRKRIVDDIRIL